MKLETPINKNYCAVVVELPETRIPLDGLDKIEGVSIFGFQVLVSKGTTGKGLFFPAETQLSDKYCYENNLYREDSRTGNLNKDKSSKGYFEKNRRVKAIKFKGNTSNALFMPLESLGWTGIDVSKLNVGDEFDFLNGNEICRKFEVFKKQSSQPLVNRGFKRADKKYMPEHIDTENFFRNIDKIKDWKQAIITQKLHGTSIRIANTLVNHKPSLIERIAGFFGANIIEHEYAYLYGSRKVIKDANNPNQQHFYNEDVWTTEGKKLDGLIPENYILYGELIGWTPEGKPIQRGYTYGLPQGTCKLYIYRITIVNEKGLITDLSWEQVKEFCASVGLNTVPELFVTTGEKVLEDRGKLITDLMDKTYSESYRNAVPLMNDKLVDEGICIRADGLLPTILKAKSPKFLLHETTMLDTGEEDLESSQT